ncbi:NADP-dependent oxidoreductase [Dyadobacter subterraneus]|uniref:NADP-dependent oxidoreductase n=1 Tax=Dyadobacter subterraneus TaxID=2773304 RepID=A0ABR9WB47_9BACT|nr:NADP-dependent oxidoreductase [Dyadobacter subterraneus]MBE9462369.1 NADP-dependent oxidoreductase [Dyadobacter subterraneus]
MKAITLKDFGPAENLVLQEIPKPVISAEEVLIQVKAISVNPVDIKTRSGKAQAKVLSQFDPIILGWDASGVITEIGENVMKFKVGDAVFGMINFPGHGKCYAEYVAAPASHLALKPENVSFEEAAASTLAAITAWQVLVDHAKIKENDKILIHAAAGGVGHFAIQIAKHLGAYVIGTSSTENKDFVLSLGADQHIDYKNERFEEVVKDLDFVLDTIGGDNAIRSMEIVKKDGTIISIPSGLDPAITEKGKEKEVNVYNTSVKSNGDDVKSIADLLSKGIIKPHIFQTYSLDEIVEAHKQIETGKTVGKLIIKL